MEIRSYSLYMKATDYLKARKYPGRIIGMGMTRTGKRVVIYAIMGRSKGSRNRIFRFAVLRFSVHFDDVPGNLSAAIWQDKIDQRFVPADNRGGIHALRERKSHVLHLLSC